jgi:hypothetical protein
VTRIPANARKHLSSARKESQNCLDAVVHRHDTRNAGHPYATDIRQRSPALGVHLPSEHKNVKYEYTLPLGLKFKWVSHSTATEITLVCSIEIIPQIKDHGSNCTTQDFHQ